MEERPNKSIFSGNNREKREASGKRQVIAEIIDVIADIVVSIFDFFD